MSTSKPERPAAGHQRTAPVGDEREVDNVHSVVWTTVICAIVLLAAHGALGYNYWRGTNSDPTDDLHWPWQSTVGAALSLVAVVAFGGFYVASRRARVAIGATFILTFLAMLSFALMIPAIGHAAAESDFVEGLVDQFTRSVATVIAAYFGTEAVISGIKLWKVAGMAEDPEEVKRADRDLATTVKREATTGPAQPPAPPTDDPAPTDVATA